MERMTSAYEMPTSLGDDIAEHALPLDSLLRESETRYRQLFEYANDSILVFDAAQRILDANPCAVDVTGMPREALCGRVLWDFIPASDHPALAQAFAVLAVEGTHRGKCRYYRQDGRVGVLEYSAALVGRGRYQAILRDITARQHRQDELTRARNYYHALVDAFPLLVWRSDPEGRIEYVNDSWLAFTGCTLRETVGHGWLARVHPDDRAQILHHIESSAEHHPPFEFVYRMQRYDGVYRELRNWARPVFTPGGEYAGYIGAGLDITEHEAARRSLEQERSFLASVMDTVSIPLSVFHAGGAEQMRNRAAQDFMTAHYLQSWRDFLALDPQSHTVVPLKRLPFALALCGKITEARELIVVTPDGAETPILAYAAPIHDEAGTIIAVVQAFQDITALKEFDRAKDEFLAVLSHELRSPLTSMLGWTEMARATQNPEVVTQALDVIDRNAKRQKHLVDELLDAARISHRKLTISPEPVDLMVLTTQCVEGKQPAIRDKGLSLQMTHTSAGLPIQADPMRMAQVISNLLSNAIRYTDTGGAIHVVTGRHEDMAWLSITDAGRGIPPEKLAILFTPFTQLQRDQGAGGLGLGLSLVKGIIELHHGTVTAASPGEGLGSTFTISLPLRELT